MNFEISKRELQKGVALMQSVTGRKTTLPILSHIFMEWKSDSLYLAGTDLETGILEELNATVHQPGKASVSSKKLYEILRELPDEMLSIQKKGNNWITLQCGKSHFNLAGLDPDEFPSLPGCREEDFSKISRQVFREMIEKTVFAASNEESRYHLNGVLFLQIKQGEKDVLRMVATDGHRLSLFDRQAEMVHGIEEGIIIPKKGVLEIRKVLGDRNDEEEMGVYFNQTHGFFKIAKSLMVIRLIDGEFPDYEQVIPKENDKKVFIERERIYSSLRRVSTMASERVEGVKFFLKENYLELSSFHQDFGDAREEVEVSYKGPSFEIGFNARYLIEALNAIGAEEVLMELKDEASPGIMRPSSSAEFSDQLCIIMPMRI